MYPGAAPLVSEPERWRCCILDALVETTIARDGLPLTRVGKPALLRRFFELGGRYSGQVLSYKKMLGQFHDAGNTTTLAHYLDLLSDGCGIGEMGAGSRFDPVVPRIRGPPSPPRMRTPTLPVNASFLLARKQTKWTSWRAPDARWQRSRSRAVAAATPIRASALLPRRSIRRDDSWWARMGFRLRSFY